MINTYNTKAWSRSMPLGIMIPHSINTQSRTAVIKSHLYYDILKAVTFVAVFYVVNQELLDILEGVSSDSSNSPSDSDVEVAA